MEAQKPLEQETPETTPQEAPTATIPQPESTPAANPEADPIPEEMDASPESPAKKTAGKLAALIGGGIVAVLGIFYLVLCIVSASHGTILGRTDVMGVDMSGLTVPQAQERWQQKGQAVCQAAQLPLTLDGETAGQVSLWELGVSVTPETAAQLAYDAGHSGHFLENGWSLLRSWFRETSLTPPWTADDAALQEKAAELAEQLDIDPAKITMESDIMSDFEADSLDIVDMVMTLEDEFGIEVPDDAIESLRTVGDVVNFVDSHAQN